MKRNEILKIVFASIAVVCASAFFTGCPDPNGLHNQKAANVTFVFTNFSSAADGTYAIPGNFNNWTNTASDIVISGGEGTSSAISVAESNIQFSLVPVKEWTRPWYPEIKGNGSDGGVMQNFYIDGLNLDLEEITIVIDGSSGTGTPAVK